LAQGYFIAKPMPAGEIPDWISAWEANIESKLLNLYAQKAVS
jgi:EAL domain-containing protein (putative c-di-GMP-specific phosphodiesterase class I)